MTDPEKLDGILANLLRKRGMKAVLTALIANIEHPGGYLDPLATDLKAALDRYERRYSREGMLDVIETIRKALADAFAAQTNKDLAGIRQGIHDARNGIAELEAMLPPTPPVM